MFGSISARVLGVFTVLAVLATVSAFDASKVDNSTKLTWCQNQIGWCTNVCQEITADQGAQGKECLMNQCDIVSLDFVCICYNNFVPNVTEYTYTIPYFKCVFDVEGCKGSCPLADNSCYAACSSRSCAAQSPKKYNQTIATSLSTPTATGGIPQGTGLPPIFNANAAGYSNRLGVQSWTAVGGSSLLGLAVFLTVGVMFGGDHRMD